ncbi:hypothetical protein FEM48_Zijuj08G0167000 [Ziziphus jujuba var. spinosa]|uniref:Uncharacterized protein n=1 Tax=Ziziphus jujuba var. spinosa TaxID=714518 RepID=A0A978V080_ZIZJJ|nr:hypothetical protein FEM48_Zijuj08G0167000 [Ziziphus jujuba var. spinosa]
MGSPPYLALVKQRMRQRWRWRILRLELLVKKSTIELELLEVNLRNDQRNWATQNPSSKLLFQLDPWIGTPNSSKFGESMLQELAKQSGGASEGKGVLGITNTYSSNLLSIGYQSGIPLLTPKPPVSPNFITTYSTMQNEKIGSKPISDQLHSNMNEVMKWSMMSSTTNHTASDQNVMNISAAGLPINPERSAIYTHTHTHTHTYIYIRNIYLPLCKDYLYLNLRLYNEVYIPQKRAATINNMNIEEKSDTIGKNLAHSTQINSPSQPASDSLLLVEEMMGNDNVSVAGNPIDELLEWDGFVFAETLDLEDFDIPFE